MNSPVGIGGAFTIFVNSLLAMLVILEIVSLTDVAIAAINLVVVNGVVLASSVFAYMRSTPINNPVLPEGTRVTVQTPKGEDDRMTTV